MIRQMTDKEYKELLKEKILEDDPAWLVEEKRYYQLKQKLKKSTAKCTMLTVLLERVREENRALKEECGELQSKLGEGS